MRYLKTSDTFCLPSVVSGSVSIGWAVRADLTVSELIVAKLEALDSSVAIGLSVPTFASTFVSLIRGVSFLVW